MVYIILVNFNSYSDTEECIVSLLSLSFCDYRIVVVDNSDDCKYVNLLKDKFASDSVFYNESSSYNGINQKRIVFIKARENRGFAAANNVGLKYVYSQPEYSFVWLLNNDTVVDPNSLSVLYQKMIANPDIAICGAKLMDFYYKDRIQEIAGVYNEKIAKITFVGKNAFEETEFSDFRIDYVPGASMFISPLFLERYPYMCEDYFLYFEELDWSQKVKECGLKLDVALCAKVYHKGGATISGKSATLSTLAEYYQSRNRVIFTYKYYRKYIPLVVLTFIPIFFNRLRRNEAYKIPIMLKAVRDAFKWIHNQ